MMKEGFPLRRKGRGQHGSSKSTSFILLLALSVEELKMRGPGYIEHQRWQFQVLVLFFHGFELNADLSCSARNSHVVFNTSD